MKKTLSITLVWIIFNLTVLTIQACNPHDCNSGPFNFKLISIGATLKRLTSELPTDYLPTEKGIRYDSVGIEVSNEITTASSNSKANWIDQTFACSPVENYEKLKEISIVSSANYNLEYPKGSELKHIILVKNDYDREDEEVASIELNHELDGRSILLMFKAPPAQDNVHDITITYKLTNGKELQTKIESLKINK